MPRKKHNIEPIKQDRWLISYADFITLLFAFFVTMYAISSINNGNYKALSDSLDDAFGLRKKASDEPAIKKETPVVDAVSAPVIEQRKPEDIPDREKKQNEANEALGTIAEQLYSAFEQLVEDDLISLQKTDDWLELEIKNKILFKSGRVELGHKATPILKEIAKILKPFPNVVYIEGFTDNVPIDNIFYPSNWELSVIRSASVVRLLSQFGVDAKRMAAIGYGKFQPVASNATASGRQKNRRIAIVITRDINPRRNVGTNIESDDKKKSRSQPQNTENNRVQQPVVEKQENKANKPAPPGAEKNPIEQKKPEEKLKKKSDIKKPPVIKTIKQPDGSYRFVVE